jgi:hypothetical protein
MGSKFNWLATNGAHVSNTSGSDADGLTLGEICDYQEK